MAEPEVKLMQILALSPLIALHLHICSTEYLPLTEIWSTNLLESNIFFSTYEEAVKVVLMGSLVWCPAEYGEFVQLLVEMLAPAGEWW